MFEQEIRNQIESLKFFLINIFYKSKGIIRLIAISTYDTKHLLMNFKELKSY